MKEVGGMWLPDGDKHFAKVMASDGHYSQEGMIDLALPYVKKTRMAFDIGAHVGYLSRRMLRSFEFVIAWEPILENYECLARNVGRLGCYTRNLALGTDKGTVILGNPAPKNSGAWERAKEGVEVWVSTLDKEVLDLIDGPLPDLVKIDVQGMEPDVLMGGERLLTSSKPAILIEANDGKRIAEILGGWGAEKVWEHRSEQLWAWR